MRRGPWTHRRLGAQTRVMRSLPAEEDLLLCFLCFLSLGLLSAPFSSSFPGVPRAVFAEEWSHEGVLSGKRERIVICEGKPSMATPLTNINNREEIAILVALCEPLAPDDTEWLLLQPWAPMPSPCGPARPPLGRESTAADARCFRRRSVLLPRFQQTSTPVNEHSSEPSTLSVGASHPQCAETPPEAPEPPTPQVGRCGCERGTAHERNGPRQLDRCPGTSPSVLAWSLPCRA